MAIKTLFKFNLSILDSYLTKEFLSPFALAVGGFAIIGIVDILFYLVELAILSGVSVFTVTRLLVYKLPGIMVLFFPMSALFATMLLFVRMAKDNELSVLRTSGIHSFRIIVPILILGMGVSLISFTVNEQLVPIANQASDNLIKRELRKTPPPSIAENTVFKDSNRFFYIKKIKSNTLEKIVIIEQTFSFPRIIIAQEGGWKDFKWTLYDGTIQEFDKKGHLKFVNSFDEMLINVNQNIRAYYKRQKKAKEMDSRELKDKISRLAKSGLETQALAVEYHLKKSIPTTCLVFVLIGIAYCLSFVRTGKDWWGVIISICVAVLTVGFYFFLLALFRALAKDNQIPALLGAWGPNLIYLSISSTMIYYQCTYR